MGSSTERAPCTSLPAQPYGSPSCSADPGAAWDTSLGSFGRQQLERVDPHPAREALHALEREVALTALDATHVGAVDSQQIGECLLAEPSALPVGPDVAPHRALKIALHARNASRWILDGLQTYE